ncbi:hypothetical protein C2845_PM06G04190 [Panicum miliaceum]|uniref:Phospholipase/carboxylesterase/thioesterase domain-containing protein n=1 Tax=Panicum miliaceum TaxID=4540 RepID=A0A3L6R659_PANMI|nr:hypothetical protein C2845_PM06G04190 [Panicum miliaceum]
MSYYGSSSSGGRSGRRVDYGRTYVVRPKGRHLATIVWLHGLGDNGARQESQFTVPVYDKGLNCSILVVLPLSEFLMATLSFGQKSADTGPSSWILFLCQISSGYVPQQQPILSLLLVDSLALHPEKCLITIFGNETGFDVEDTSIDGRDDIEGLDASAAHIANLLSSEPSDEHVSAVKLGIGGFSMGATVALHSVACYAHGKFTSGIPYPITLNAVISLSGWLPCSRTLRSKMESSHIDTRRAASLPILLCHGRVDEVVTYRNGERSAEILRSSGFSYLSFKPYNGYSSTNTTPEKYKLSPLQRSIN